MCSSDYLLAQLPYDSVRIDTVETNSNANVSLLCNAEQMSPTPSYINEVCWKKNWNSLQVKLD